MAVLKIIEKGLLVYGQAFCFVFLNFSFLDLEICVVWCSWEWDYVADVCHACCVDDCSFET